MHFTITKKLLTTLFLLSMSQTITANKVKKFSTAYTTFELCQHLKSYGTFDQIIAEDNNLYESQFL